MTILSIRLSHFKKKLIFFKSQSSNFLIKFWYFASIAITFIIFFLTSLSLKRGTFWRQYIRLTFCNSFYLVDQRNIFICIRLNQTLIIIRHIASWSSLEFIFQKSLILAVWIITVISSCIFFEDSFMSIMRIGCGLKTIDLTWCTTSIVILDLLSFLLINRFLTWIVLNKRLSD